LSDSRVLSQVFNGTRALICVW